MVRQTSLDIYFIIKENKLLSKMRFKFFDCIFYSGPLTASQVFQILGCKTNQSGRITELQQLGVIKEYDTVICPITNHKAIRWVVTYELPKTINKPPNRKKLILDKILTLELHLTGTEKEMLNEIYKGVKSL